MANQELVLVLDYGSPYNQKLTRKIRELGVYSELHPHTLSAKDIEQQSPKAIVISGGQKTFGTHLLDEAIFSLQIPMLFISGANAEFVSHFGGQVRLDDNEDNQLKKINHLPNVLCEDLPTEQEVFLNRSVHITELPKQLQSFAEDRENRKVMIKHETQPFYGVLFHPEAKETINGDQMLKNFLFKVAKCDGQWSMKQFIESKIAEIRKDVGKEKVLCALSGGVDSSVVAALMHRAIGDQLTCIFVDHGLLRKNEAEDVMALFVDDFKINMIKVDAKDRFLSRLKGVEDPEEKRKIIGNEFIYVFDDEAEKLKDMDYLAQGTLYTDILESGFDGSKTIKSHHNVGGLPEDMEFKLIEPISTLFKDEVRELGTALGLPDSIVWRQPFPGPGLAIRILGEVTEEKLTIVRESDAVLREEIARAGLERDIWQYFTVLPDIRSVGVTDGKRTYDHTIALRAVTSVDGTASDWARIPWDVLDQISKRIVAEVEGVNRVVYDITSKPPATIEWE